MVIGFQDITEGMFSSSSEAATLWSNLIFKCVNKQAPDAQYQTVKTETSGGMYFGVYAKK